MTPERAAYDLAEAQYTNLDLGIGWWEELPSILEKQCVDRGDDKGFAFWVTVHTEYLMLDTHFTVTGELPPIERDDPQHYLAMMLWDEGWGTPDLALWTARRYGHDRAIQYLQRMDDIWRQAHDDVEAHRLA